MENNRFRIRIAPGFWTSRYGIALLCMALAVLLAGTSLFAYYYVQFGRLINERLTGQIFQNTSRVYAAPAVIYVGEALHPKDLATYLLRAGYQESEVAGAPVCIRFPEPPSKSGLRLTLIFAKRTPFASISPRLQSRALLSFRMASLASPLRSNRN